MNEIDLIKERMKKKRSYRTNPIQNTNGISKNKYVNNLITRTLFSVVLFLITIIIVNFSDEAKIFFKNDIYGNNVSFGKVLKYYNKYFGNIIPLKDVGTDTKTVFNEKIIYNNIEKYKEGFNLSVENNYLVPYIESGIVVFIGEKEGYGNTVIIQGIDGIDYWYSNIQNTSTKMYDYVTKGTLLGTSKGNKLYLTFLKDGKYLDYEEVL